MAFTDKFIKVRCFLYSTKESDLMNREPGECTLISVVRYINPARIETFVESIPQTYFREDNKIWTSVTLMSSECFIVDMPVAEFKKLLNSFNEKDQANLSQ